jgi:hypothetical protein
MEAGTTFLRADNDRHLWIIISDQEVNPNQVLIVNLTSVDDRKKKFVCFIPVIIPGLGMRPALTTRTQ